jgi:hypothetical protein
MVTIGVCAGVLYLLITAGVTLVWRSQRDTVWTRARDEWLTDRGVTRGPRFSTDPRYAREREREAA